MASQGEAPPRNRVAKPGVFGVGWTNLSAMVFLLAQILPPEASLLSIRPTLAFPPFQLGIEQA